MWEYINVANTLLFQIISRKIKAMNTNYVSCKEETTKKYSVKRTKQKTLMLVSNCFVCAKEKSRSIKNQETSMLLSDLGLKTALNKILVSGDIFYKAKDMKRLV